MTPPDATLTTADSSPPAARRYGAAVVAVAVVTVVRFAMQPLVSHEAPFLLFYAAVMATGWYGGFGPGMLTTGLCAAVTGYFFMEPVNRLELSSWQVGRLFVFLLEGLVTSGLCGQLHAARRRAERSAAESRELERTVEQISEAEQRRIGQDLHDGLGQHLTGVAFLSKALQQRLAADRRPESADAATINQLVNESIRWTRDLARGLAPMDLDRTSLPESLRELARKTSRMFNVECTYDGVETICLADDDTALNLYRVAQEAVSNAVKHGKAKRVTVDLEVGPPGLTLSVQDDGVGFDPAAVTARAGSAGGGQGMGLLVMRYRAGAIGGRLDVRSAVGGGTVVRCRVPPELARATRATADPPSWPAGDRPPAVGAARPSPT
jgi:signal transduction histidine kinase